MKVLVTGGAGFIGSHTVDLLLKKGYEVRVYDSLEPPVHPRRGKPAYVPDEVEFISGDICDSSKLGKALQGIDVVFHFASYQDYLPDFSKFAFINDGGTALLYELIVNHHLPVQKVILASSQAVYGEGKYECSNHGGQYPSLRPLAQLMNRDWEIRCPICQQSMKPVATDESQTNPHNQYAVSKCAQELYALILGKRYDIPTVAMRYTIIRGPRQSFFNAYSGILRIFSVCLLHDLPLPIYEDGQQLREYVYVGDAARANVLVMEKEEANYQVFNVGGSRAFSVLEYARILLDLMGKDIELNLSGEFRFGDTRHIISDMSKLQKLGWEPTTSVKQIVREYLDWIQTQPEISNHYAQAAEKMKQMGIIRKAT